MIKEIAALLVARVPTLTRGTTLQIGWRDQNAPVDCDLISESAGGPAYFDIPERADVLIQVLSRGSSYFTARARAYAIFDAIHGTAGWSMPALTSGGHAYIAQTIEAMAVPQYLGPEDDSPGSFLFTCNYIFRILRTS
jgi:hypothetical protein